MLYPLICIRKINFKDSTSHSNIGALEMNILCKILSFISNTLEATFLFLKLKFIELKQF